MRFEIDLPSSQHSLAYGYDPATGDWFGELIHNGKERVLASYDATSPGYDRRLPLSGLLTWIGKTTGAYDEDSLHEALERLLTEGPERLPKRLRLAGQIVTNLKRAGNFGQP